MSNKEDQIIYSYEKQLERQKQKYEDRESRLQADVYYFCRELEQAHEMERDKSNWPAAKVLERVIKMVKEAELWLNK